METKYKGIDSRKIKCCCENPDCIESGIDFDTDNSQNILRFHFLDYVKDTERLTQKTKSMYLNKENVKELIEYLEQLEF